MTPRNPTLHPVKPDNTLNKLESPAGLDLAEATGILTQAREALSLSERMAWLSEYFLGRPYIEGSLGGGPDLPEEFRVTLEAFDCVTYIEVVLAMALSQTTDEFVDAIRRIRYKDGQVEWFSRNHYMVDWARNNEELGIISNLTAGPLTSDKTCTLDLIAGLPPGQRVLAIFQLKAWTYLLNVSKPVI